MQQKFINQINESISEFLKNNPLRDFEKNIKALFLALFNKLDLVTREEFEIQQKVLIATREKVEKLEQTIKQLTEN